MCHHIVMAPVTSGKRRCASYSEEHKTHALPPGALHAFMKMLPQPCKSVLVTLIKRRITMMFRL